MLLLITCNGYKVIRELARDADAPAECRAEEIARNDSFAVFAQDNGRTVADAEGWIESRGELSYTCNAHTSVGGESE